MTKNTHKDAVLLAALAEARAATPEPDAGFMARVLADGLAVQDEIAAQDVPPVTSSAAGWRGILAALGGWPAVTGLSAAMVAGLWIGVVSPAALNGVGIGESQGDIVLAFEPDLGVELFPAEED